MVDTQAVSEIDYSDPGSVKDIRARFRQTDYTRDIACPKKFVLNGKPAPAAKPIKPSKHNFSGSRIDHYLNVKAPGSIKSASGASLTSNHSSSHGQTVTSNGNAGSTSTPQSPSVVVASQQITSTFQSRTQNLVETNSSSVDRSTDSGLAKFTESSAASTSSSSHRHSSGQSVQSQVSSKSGSSNCNSQQSASRVALPGKGHGHQSLRENNLNISFMDSQNSNSMGGSKYTSPGSERARASSGASSRQANSVRKSVSDMFDDAIRTASTSQVQAFDESRLEPSPHINKVENAKFQKPLAPLLIKANSNQSLENGVTSPASNHSQNSNNSFHSNSQSESNSSSSGYKPRTYRPVVFKKPTRHQSESGLLAYCGKVSNDLGLLDLIDECQEFLDLH